MIAKKYLVMLKIVAVTCLLLSSGLAVCQTTADLMVASSKGDSEKVKALLAAGADVNAKGQFGETALIVASMDGHIEVMKLLLAAGADVNAKAGNNNPTTKNVPTKGNEVVRIEFKPTDIDIIYFSGETALMLASKGGYIEIVKMLLAAGADVNAKGKYGETTLIQTADRDMGAGLTQDPLAARTRTIEMVKLLLAADADVNAKNDKGDTALIRSSMVGSVEVVKLLLAAGADVNASASQALIMASNNGRIEVVKQLLAAGADVNAKGQFGETALKRASNYDNTEIRNQLIKLLRKAGARE
jgi:uncharacterized protein